MTIGGERIGPAFPRTGEGRGPRSASAAVILLMLLGGAAAAGDLPEVVAVAAPERLRAGEPGELRLTYRARRANVVAVVQAVEDLDGPFLSRSTREREIDVLVRAFGREAGELVLPVSFATAGAKRVTLSLVTDRREVSDPAVLDIEVLP